MKNQLFYLFVSVVLFSFPEINFSQTLDSLTLIAHNPLLSTANDTSCMNAPMDLLNVPLQDGGIYCNGIYNNGTLQNVSSTITLEIENQFITKRWIYSNNQKCALI